MLTNSYKNRGIIAQSGKKAVPKYQRYRYDAYLNNEHYAIYHVNK